MIANHRPTPSLYAAAARSLMESAAAPYEALMKHGMPEQDLLAKIVDHMDVIEQSAASEAEKERAASELLRFIETRITDNGGLFDDGWVPAGYVREDLNEWNLRSLFGQKKAAAKPRKPRMPKVAPPAATPKPTASTRTPAVPVSRSTTTPQPRRPVFGGREHQPIHDIHFHSGLRVFAGHVHGQPLGKAMSERALYGHLINKHGYTHDRAIDYIHAAKHGENSPNDATLPVHKNIQMAAFHLAKAHEAHVMSDHPRRETHLGFAERHFDAATMKAEGAP
jgi:hypothetical protein